MFGQALAAIVAQGDTIGLVGPLGAGKSLLARSIIQELMGRQIDVPSPTYTLVEQYESERGPICHLDLYRLSSVQEALNIGLDDMLESTICLIEWADKVASTLPSTTLLLSISAVDETTNNASVNSAKNADAPRQLMVVADNVWQERLERSNIFS